MSHRPGRDDASEPRIAEALELLHTDASLAAWFESRQAVDRALISKFADIHIPPGLATRIVANRPNADEASPTWLSRWQNPVYAFLAVAVVALAVFSFPSERNYRVYRTTMIAFVAQPYAMDFHVETLGEVNRLMAGNGYPHTDAIPPSLRNYPVEGGCKRDWKGQKVSLYCFGDEEEGKPDVWLFIAPVALLPDAPGGSDPVFYDEGGMATATWVKDDLRFLAVAESEYLDLAAFITSP